MKIIKLTSKKMNKPVYVNINHIGDFYEYDGGTSVGVTSHNNGGFNVKESVEEVLKLINDNYNIDIMENKEIRVYKINTFDYEFDTSPTQWGNEKFIREAEIQGGAYTLKGFEEAFNNQDVSADIDFIRIL